MKLTDEEITRILADNQSKLNLSEKQKERWHKKCLCLVEFENVEEITPLAFEHKNNMDDWLILENPRMLFPGQAFPTIMKNQGFECCIPVIKLINRNWRGYL